MARKLGEISLMFLVHPTLSVEDICVMDGFFTLAFVAGLRISKRLYLEVIREKGAGRKGKRTLIIGAGNTDEMLLRDMARVGFAAFYPIGFLDDDRTKAGMQMHGVRVLGDLRKMEEVIAIPSLSHKPLRELYDAARKLKIGTIKVVPRIYDFDKPEARGGHWLSSGKNWKNKDREVLGGRSLNLAFCTK